VFAFDDQEPTGDTATQPSVNVDDLVTEEAATAIPPIAGHANGKEPAVVEVRGRLFGRWLWFYSR